MKTQTDIPATAKASTMSRAGDRDRVRVVRGEISDSRQWGPGQPWTRHWDL